MVSDDGGAGRWRPRAAGPERWLAVLAGVLVVSALAMAPLDVLSHLQFDASMPW